jgi:hypothetical protein
VRLRALAAVALALALSPSASAQQTPQEPDPSDVVDALLGGLMGLTPVSPGELQEQVAAAGGIPFKREVPLDFMTRPALAGYLKDLLDDEYPVAKAEADERMLSAFGMLPKGFALRAARTRLLLENVVGFYDERPGHKRLYAVSSERTLSPANQLVLAHELRHAEQDQYMNVHDLLPAEVSDFDDRSLALLSLLEGDATFVMERFLVARLPDGGSRPDLDGLSLPTPEMPGVPDVLRDELVAPYLVGLDFVRRLYRDGGWGAVRRAWDSPPQSTEQVLHPDKYGEAPRGVNVPWVPPGGRLLLQGTLGELLTRTLLGGEQAEAAAAGWGGDRFRCFDVNGGTLLVWLSVWDSSFDRGEFHEALLARYGASDSGPRRHGFAMGRAGAFEVAVSDSGDGVLLLSSDDAQLLEQALRRFGTP